LTHEVKELLGSGQTSLGEYYSNSDDCGSHYSVAPGDIFRSFAHIHFATGWGQFAQCLTHPNEQPNSTYLSLDNIRRAWGVQNPPYASVIDSTAVYYGYSTYDGEDITKNCHGYSFWYAWKDYESSGIWIQDTSRLLADEYNGANGWEDTALLSGGNTHSALGYGYPDSNQYGEYIVMTSEKNQASGIYSRTWHGNPGGQTSHASSKMKFKLF